MGSGENELVETVEDMKIPVLTSLVYTTGRGGTVGFPSQLSLTVAGADVGMNREIWHSMIPRTLRRPVGLKMSKNHRESSAVASFMADAGYVS